MTSERHEVQDLTYVVGEEKRIVDILSETDVMPLLRRAVRSGISEATITDDSGVVLWTFMGDVEGATGGEPLPLYVEGEPAGKLVIRGVFEKKYLQSIASVLQEALNNAITSNLKRKLTTEIHTTVVNQSYEELLERNRRLLISEANYRSLSENLDKKVRERTKELENLYLRMMQQEKMAAVGQLAAGMAHEINNPLGFITSNLHTLEKYVNRLMSMLHYYRSSLAGTRRLDETREEALLKWRELKLDFVSVDVAELLSQSIGGAERVSKIVNDLKGFAHMDDQQEAMTDLNAEIEMTLNVLSHDIPADAVITRDFRPLPAFRCNAGLICQAFLNIILNAIQSCKKNLRLKISTYCINDRISIVFSDNGPGIPPDIRKRIFEPFYTTRDVGSGMGMGLTVAYNGVRKYGGTIEVACPGGGTDFTVTLPVTRND